MRKMEEAAFFEYHMYTLKRPTTLADNSSKQVEMASAAGLLGGCFFNSLGMIAMMHIPEKEGGAKRAKLAAQKAREAGVFLRPLGPVLYVWPPLTVSENELREIFRVLKKVLLAARE